MKYIILHHTGNTGKTKQEILKNLKLENKVLNFDFYIDKNGYTFYKKQHNKAYNIYIEGDFNDINTVISSTQKAAIKSLIARLKNKNIYTHNLLYNNNCPGRFFPLSEIFNT